MSTAMRSYEQARALVEEHLDEAEFESQPEDRVARAERELGVRFPPSYRQFLLDLGAGGVGGEEIYGLVNDDFEDVRPPQAVGLTREFRRDGQVSEDLVVIYNLGKGSYFALDTRAAGDDGEAPVVAFTPGIHSAGDELQIVAPDFGAFFLETVRADLG
ncbi:SMI1/KNR4 family protein [Patulibacter sp. NPDC049589]|uniref:SMI1/KNR4 family protein n=1 Tax=Patulibacter sp. NPDC049589 TaxID=3154731 RepID=UPI0034407475